MNIFGSHPTLNTELAKKKPVETRKFCFYWFKTCLKPIPSQLSTKSVSTITVTHRA